MTQVLVVDDQPLIRQAVRALIEAEPDLTVVGEAGDGAAAVDLVERLRPDVVLMDIRMPGMDGIEATRRIVAAPGASSTRILILTTFEDDDNVAATLSAGASGFVGKGSDPREIVAAIRVVAAGESLLSPHATRVLIERFLQSAPTPPDPRELAAFRDLTDRELEILVLVATGLSNSEIAERLVISPHTAKTHLNRIMPKLHAHDRAQLVVLAYEHGLVQPGLSA